MPAKISFECVGFCQAVQDNMEFSAKFVLLQQVLKRLIQFLAIQLVQLQEKILHFFIIKLLQTPLLEYC